MKYETKTFKYLNPKKLFLRLLAQIKTFHENLKAPRGYYGHDSTYRAFAHWLLDAIEIGLLLELCFVAITGWHGWKTLLFVPAFGIAWYLVMRFIKEVKEALKD